MVILSACAKAPENLDLQIELAEKNKTIEQLVQSREDLITQKVELEKQVDQLQHAQDQSGGTVGPLESPVSNLWGPSEHILPTSLEVVALLKDKDMVNLSGYVHPNKGLRFSPYFYTDIQNDQTFTVLEVGTLDQNTDTFVWGHYDGSGEPIHLTFNDYYSEFIYDEDFINPQLIGNNIALGSGNTLDNVAEAYPNGQFTEFHFQAIDPQYAGIDWRSLRLVFEQDNGLWYLVGIIHGQWTI